MRRMGTENVFSSKCPSFTPNGVRPSPFSLGRLLEEEVVCHSFDGQKTDVSVDGVGWLQSNKKSWPLCPAKPVGVVAGEDDSAG